MSLTSFRQTLITQFTTDVGIPFIAGKPDPKFYASPDRSIGFVWPVSINEVTGRVDEEELRLMVLVFIRFTSDPSPENPTDPTPLEALMDLLKTSVKNHQTGEGPWFQRVSGVVYDMDRQAFEATVYARELNASLY